jgi:hypothetical protein
MSRKPITRSPKKSVVRKAKKSVVRKAKKSVCRKAKKSVVRKAKKSVCRKAKKSVVRKAKKSVVRKAKKSVDKKDVYHVTVKLVLQPNLDLEKEKQPSREDFLAHLRKHFGDEDMYSLVEYDEPSYMLDAKLNGDVLTFDVPKHLADNKQDLKRVLSHSLADGSWEAGSNFFHMMTDDEMVERAVISYKVLKIQ